MNPLKNILATISLCLATAIAFWPVWRWYGLRTIDGSDEPWGVAALALALCVSYWRRGHRASLSGRSVLIMGVIVSGYAALYPHLPMLILACLACAVIWVGVRGIYPSAQLGLPFLVLLILSLPLMATLQFYLGYPMRWVTASGATALLDMGSIPVTRQGLTLVCQGEHVLIDAPCSGIRMLWTGAFLSASLAHALKFKTLKTVALGAAAFALVLVGNVVRAAWIFLEATGRLDQPAWMHKGAGVVVFALLGWGVMCLAFRMDRRVPCTA